MMEICDLLFGVHSNNERAGISKDKSRHTTGQAADINRINGIRVDSPRNRENVGTVGVQAVFDDDGNFDVQVTWGTGATTSTTSGGSATLDVTATNADTVDDLNGPGLEKNVSYNPARVAFTQSIHATSGYLGSTTSLGIGLGKNPAGFSVNTMATFTRSLASSRSNAPCP